MTRYQVKIEPDDNGTLLVTCPALPEVTTFGEDEAHALRHAANAIEEALAARISEGADIPKSDKRGMLVTLPALTSLKVALYQSLRDGGISRAELMRKLKWNRESIDRLFRLDHASKLDQIEAAFRAIGRSISVNIEKVA